MIRESALPTPSVCLLEQQVPSLAPAGLLFTAACADPTLEEQAQDAARAYFAREHGDAETLKYRWGATQDGDHLAFEAPLNATNRNDDIVFAQDEAEEADGLAQVILESRLEPLGTPFPPPHSGR